MWKLLQKEEEFYSHRDVIEEKTLFFFTMRPQCKYSQLPQQARDKRGGCVFLSERDKVMMHTSPTVHRHITNCLLTAFQLEFNSNFFLWLLVSAGHGIVALWGEDGAVQQ